MAYHDQTPIAYDSRDSSRGIPPLYSCRIRHKRRRQPRNRDLCLARSGPSMFYRAGAPARHRQQFISTSAITVDLDFPLPMRIKP